MMHAYKVDWIKLPMMGERFDLLQEEGKDGTDLEDHGEYLEINFSFSRDEQAERAAVTRPMVCKGGGLKHAYTKWP